MSAVAGSGAFRPPSLSAVWRSNLPATMRPTFNEETGRWRAPKFSVRKRAALKRDFYEKNPAPSTEMYPLTKPLRPLVVTVRKGHIWQKLQADKVLKIEAAMKEMPKKLEEYYKIMRNRRIPDSQLNRLLGKAAGKIAQNAAKEVAEKKALLALKNVKK